MANYREPQWLLPNEKNLAMPASDATVGSGLAEDRQSLYSMDFDGNNDYIDCGDNDLLSFGNGSSDSPFTVSSWIYAKGSSTFPFFDKYPDAGTWALREYRMEVFGTDKVVLIIYDGSASARHEIYSDSLITRDQWQHVVITYDGRGGATAGDGVKIYINGSESTTTIVSYGTYVAMENTTSPVRIGRVGSGYADGKIDETAVWNKALSASEVSALTTASAPANILALSAKPIAYYPLGEQARLGSEWQFPNEVLQSQVFDFDGTDDVIDLGTGLVGTGTKSISFWIKRNSGSPSNDGGIFTIAESGSPSSYISIALWQDLIQSSIGNSTNHKGSTTIAVDTWYHVMVVKDSSATTAIYVNGVAETLSTGGTWVGSIDTPQAKIGGISYSSTSYNFQGEISNVAVWYSDQSANIDNIYNNGSPQSSYTTTPTAWYKLNATSNYAGLNPNFHNALSFDGSNDYIDAGNPTELQLTGALTFSGWIKTSSATYQLMISKDDVTNRCYNFGLLNNGEVYGQVFSSGSATTVQTTTTWKDGNWHHIAFVYIPSASIEIFVDGNSEILSTSSIPASIDNDPANFNIGRRTDGARYFNGSLSNVAIYNQAISAEDVLYLYNGGTPQTSLSFEPLSWWKLDNLTTGIQDSGSASNNGTNNGATEVTDSVAVDQWNFDNVSHAQTPTYTKCLQTTTTADRVVTGGVTAPSMDYIYLSTWYRSTDTLEKILFSNNLANLYVGTTRVYITTHHGAVYRSFPVQVMDGNWHHIIYGFPNTGGSVTLTDMKVWVDGKEIAGANAGGGSMTGNVTSINGLYTGTGQNPASVSNYSFFNTDMSSNIATMYNNGTPGDISSLNPYLWYKLNNTASSSSSDGLYDNGSGSNNGTLSGTWNNINTNVLTSRLNGESTTLPSTALVSSDLQFESPYSNFSLDFDGTNNYITSDSVPSQLNTVSLSIWVKRNGNQNSAAGVFGVRNTGVAAPTYGVCWDLTFNGTTNKIEFRVSDTAYKTVIQDAVMTDDTWTHVVGVADGTNIFLYINGVKQADTDTYTSPLLTPTNNIYIGAQGVTPTTYDFTGRLDEAAVFNYGLNQAQITQIYNNGYPANLTSLSPTNWWRLGEDAYFVSPNFTVPNQITGAPNGTSANMDQAALVADAPGSYASGVGSSLVVTDRVGHAPESTANSLSFNMTPLNKISYPAGYVPTQADNVYSMAFDGTNDYVNLGSPSELNLTGEMSAFAWVKTNSLSGTDGVVMDLSSGGTQSQWGLEINRTAAKVSVLGNGSGAVLTGGTSLTTGTWFHIGFTRSGTASNWTYTIYVNGVSDGTITTTTNPDPQQGAAIGRLGLYNGGYFNGEIDEVAIFNYPVSARQVKQDIYNGTTTGKTADLNNISNLTAPVAWYRMGD